MVRGVEFCGAATCHIMEQFNGQGVCAADLNALEDVENAQVFYHFRIYLSKIGLMSQC